MAHADDLADLDDLDLAAALPKPIERGRYVTGEFPEENLKKPPKGFQHWYDSIIDLMISRPDLSLTAIAKEIGRSPGWMYLVVKSDSFRDHFEFRRNEHNARLSGAVIQKAQEVATTALDALLREMRDNPAKIKVADATQIAGSMMKYLGMGERESGPSVVVQQNVVASASPEELTRARELIRSAERSRVEGRAKTLELEKVDASVTDGDT